MSTGYSCNDNQNYFVSAGRTTSRVLSQPGGKQSFSLFGGGPTSSSNTTTTTSTPGAAIGETTPRKQQRTSECPAPSPLRTPIEKKHNMAASFDNPLNFSSSSFSRTATTKTHNSSSSSSSSSNAFASGSNMNSGNVMTGRSTSRVLNQPGGRTTLTLG